ncbi:alpha-L-rhamnosidase [Lacibacter sediminis]|uniref:alpha-L-rhamnosidase n=1 Tax=Lacibacter sediminis TaxID=2760713 RepID=A0A7G5XB21_9BACT|nr:alpha-L-rhamnosidase [Lacibacter sediminis]QNA42674.1 family 78 glycoside hydrolase catalytic domain [Lacibacter sediminis]
MKKLSFLLLIQLLVVSVFAQLKVEQLKTENLTNPIGLDVLQPYFSWQLVSDQRNTMQSAYELRVGTEPAALVKGEGIWKTGKINSDQSIHVPYKGAALTSNKKYYWQVRVYDNNGKASAWSTIAHWQMGLLSASDWKAQWIEPGYKEDSVFAAPLMRKEFSNSKKIKSATAYITAHGLYEAQINGKRVGDAYLTPGWTSYNKRLQYQAYDVTALLKSGANAIAVTLGDGWYRGNFSFDHRRNIYGKDIALLFQLEISYTDGTTATIVSDASWKSATGAIRANGIYQGELIDARQEKNGWTVAGYDDNNWAPVKTSNASKDILVATYNEPIKKHERFATGKLITTPKGEKVIDFGQNLVGWVQVKLRGKAGDTIKISHAEVIDKKGNFYTDNLRGAKAQAVYVLKGNGEEIFEPHFTFFGFRYIKVEGVAAELQPENFTAIALYSAMEQTGSFTSSNEKINQLQHNIEWGLRGNFLDVPTDCPQRDERMGWTGDAQAFFRTATFLRGVNNFFNKWMKDVAADQIKTGSIPHVIPNVLGEQGWAAGGSAGWADVSTIIPWEMYLVYGDKRILENQYSSMKAWVGYMQSQSTNDLWNKGSHFGDWLFYTMADDNDGNAAITNKYLIAQCFYAYSTQLLINAAKELGKKDDVATYSNLLQKIKEAFLKEYTTPNGATMSNTQTSYVLALQFDLFPEAMRQQSADRLVANIKQYGNHLTTGFLGTPYLCHVLSRYGYSDVAYTLLLQETYPSWLYPVTKGATTIWERWDGIRTNGDFQAITMNSFNHYAYGAIGDWMYRVMVGLDNEDGSIGYKKIRIRPHISGKFTHASANYQTQFGKLSSGWKLENGKLILHAEVPANTTATIYIPATAATDVLENGQPLSSAKEIQVVGKEKEYVVVKVGSGKYEFSTAYTAK